MNSCYYKLSIQFFPTKHKSKRTLRVKTLLSPLILNIEPQCTRSGGIVINYKSWSPYSYCPI